MGQCCTTKTVKYILLIFDIICAILGIAFIVLGIRLLNTIEDVKIDHGEDLASLVVITLGVVILTNAVFGIAALFMESKRMLSTFAVILFVLMAIHIILMSISYSASSDKLPSGLEKGFDELMDKLEHENSSLAVYEQWLECCGKNSAEDYALFDKLPPKSCCRDQNCVYILNVFIEGCEKKYLDYVSSRTKTFNVTSWLLIITELVTSVAACILVDQLRSHRDRIRFYNTSFD